MNAPQHAKHVFHLSGMACKPWTLISTDNITDIPESDGATMISVVVDQFMTMAHFIQMKNNDTATVARA
jgi:hypothetical protein